MANDKKDVKIIGWPKESAKLEHEFKMEEPCPVSIYFTKPPANVVIHTSPEKPLHVDMNMKVVAEDTIPVCIKLCEPICADSDYSIGLEIFDRPVGAVTVKGRTKLFNCNDEGPDKLTCIDFQELEPKIVIREPYPYQGFIFTPLGDKIVTAMIGEPSGQVKMQFPREGVRIDYPHAVDITEITLNNYANPTLKFSVFSNDTLLDSFEVEIDGEVKIVSIDNDDITAVEISGGDNEASIIEICYYPA